MSFYYALFSATQLAVADAVHGVVANDVISFAWSDDATDFIEDNIHTAVQRDLYGESDA